MSGKRNESPAAGTAGPSVHQDSRVRLTVAHMCGKSQPAHLPRALGDIRAAHEDDTADELALCEAVAARSTLANRVEADRRITWREWQQLCALDEVIEEYALKSLNNNRYINSMYGALYARRRGVFDADARALCPEIGEITIGEIIRSSDWVDLDAA